MSNQLLELLGDTLLSKNDKGEIVSVKTEVLNGKTVGVYFSAHWCPPCRQFTPELVKTYERINKDGKKFEVVFVSLDKSLAQFQGYFAEMPWLAVPFANEALRNEVSTAFRVLGVPTLALVSPEGKLLTSNGRLAVTKDPEGKNFPWEGISGGWQSVASVLLGSPWVLVMVFYFIWRMFKWALGIEWGI